jgi:hypothetical protein
MRLKLFLVVMSSCFWANPVGAGAEPKQLRCGWFENPTPGNAWFTDRDGEWLVGIQGGYQAQGNWPNFKPSRWVGTNRHYGYGCACMRVQTDPDNQSVVKIFSASSRDLDTCRKDAALKEPNYAQ